MTQVTTIYEFEALTAEPGNAGNGVYTIPESAYEWLQEKCNQQKGDEETHWLRMFAQKKSAAIRVTSYVGVIRTACGHQIEVLPKTGRAAPNRSPEEHARLHKLLIKMLRCLPGFEHIKTPTAQLQRTRMRLLEVFITEFLRSVDHVVKRGLRSAYVARQDNLYTLRGRLLMSTHLRQNRFRPDRFYTEHDEFTANRPENRLIHAALRRALTWSVSPANQQLGRMLSFVFAEIPVSEVPAQDFTLVRNERGMNHYDEALAWARLILNEESPLTGAGQHGAPSLLFPMEKVFEAYVGKHLPKQLLPGHVLRRQVRSEYLVNKDGRNYFQLKPDFLVSENGVHNHLVLDAKWKLLDKSKDKWGLPQSDFYQMLAYGLNYLPSSDGEETSPRNILLIYPKTDTFHTPVGPFAFNPTGNIRVWACPYDLERRELLFPATANLPLQALPQPEARCA